MKKDVEAQGIWFVVDPPGSCCCFIGDKTEIPYPPTHKWRLSSCCWGSRAYNSCFCQTQVRNIPFRVFAVVFTPILTDSKPLLHLCFYLKIGRLNDFICFLKLKIVIDSNFNALVSVNLKIALLCCLFASAFCFVPIAKLQSNHLDKLRFCYLAVQI